MIEIPPRGEDRFIAVDYFQHDGQVLHLPPGRRFARSSCLKAQRPLVLADPNWQIGEPFGQDMVVVLTSSRPCSRARPFLEKPGDYVADLRSARPRAASSAQYRIITTAAR